MNNKIESNKKIAKESKKDSNLSYFVPIFDNFFNYPTFSNEFRNIEKMMKTDVSETDDEVIFEIELPGFQKKDIDIELKNGYLIINAELKNNQEMINKKHIKRERYYGSISRSFYVGEINREEINAKLDSGILKIIIQKNVISNKFNKIEIS